MTSNAPKNMLYNYLVQQKYFQICRCFNKIILST